MLNGFGDIFGQVQKMQEEMKKMQGELEKKTVDTSVGGGMVKVTVNGKQQVQSLQIDPEVLKMNDTQMLQDLVIAGVNEAIKQSQQMVADEMKGLTAGLGPLASMLNPRS